MTLVGCDLHSRTQQVAVLDTRTDELVEQELPNPAVGLVSVTYKSQAIASTRRSGCAEASTLPAPF